MRGNRLQNHKFQRDSKVYWLLVSQRSNKTTRRHENIGFFIEVKCHGSVKRALTLFLEIKLLFDHYSGCCTHRFDFQYNLLNVYRKR